MDPLLAAMDELHRQLADLQERYEMKCAAFEALKIAHAELQADYLDAGRLADGSAYVEELHRLAIYEQAVTATLRQAH